MLTAMSCCYFIKQSRRWKHGSLWHDQDLDNSVIIPRLISFLCPAKKKQQLPERGKMKQSFANCSAQFWEYMAYSPFVAFTKTK